MTMHGRILNLDETRMNQYLDNNQICSFKYCKNVHNYYQCRYSINQCNSKYQNSNTRVRIILKLT